MMLPEMESFTDFFAYGGSFSKTLSAGGLCLFPQTFSVYGAELKFGNFIPPCTAHIH